MMSVANFVNCLFIASLTGALIAWLFTAYQLVMLNIRWWTTTSASRGTTAKFFDLRLLGLRSDLQGMPAAHRRRAFWGAAVFFSLIAIALLEKVFGDVLSG